MSNPVLTTCKNIHISGSVLTAIMYVYILVGWNPVGGNFFHKYNILYSITYYSPYIIQIRYGRECKSDKHIDCLVYSEFIHVNC